MKTRKQAVDAARVLRDVSDYLDDHAYWLAATHRNRATACVEPAEALAEVQRVRRWSRSLRRLALLELAP